MAEETLVDVTLVIEGEILVMKKMKETRIGKIPKRLDTQETCAKIVWQKFTHLAKYIIRIGSLKFQNYIYVISNVPAAYIAPIIPSLSL